MTGCTLFGQEHIWVVQGTYCNTYCCMPYVTSPWLTWLWLWWTVPIHAASFLSQPSQRLSGVLFSLKLQEFAYYIQRFNGINFLDRVSKCGWELVEKHFSLCLKKDNSSILFYMLLERILNRIEPQLPKELTQPQTYPLFAFPLSSSHSSYNHIPVSRNLS